LNEQLTLNQLVRSSSSLGTIKNGIESFLFLISSRDDTDMPSL
jgi:hypothetical protein